MRGKLVLLAGGVLVTGGVAAAVALPRLRPPICSSAEDCWNKAQAVATPPDDAPVQATIDYLYAQLPYYQQACEYNPTGLACVSGQEMQRVAIPNLLELQKEEATMKRIEGLQEF